MIVAFGAGARAAKSACFLAAFFHFRPDWHSPRIFARMEMEIRVPTKLVFDPNRVNQVGVRGAGPGAYLVSYTKELSDHCPILEKQGVNDPPLNDNK